MRASSDAPEVGSVDSFEDLYRRQAAPVYRLLVHRVGREAAEDLLSQVFLTAYRRRDAYSASLGSEAQWIYGIANNVVRNHRRTERRHLAARARLAGAGSLGDDADAVEGRLDASAEWSAVAGVLAQMSSRQRDAVWLYAWAGLSYAEIAAVLGIREGTVKSRISAARRQLERKVGR